MHQRLIFKTSNPHHNLTLQICNKVYLSFDILHRVIFVCQIQFKRTRETSFYFKRRTIYVNFKFLFFYVAFFSIHINLNYIVLKVSK